MDFFERKMTKRKAHVAIEAFEQHLHGGGRLLAVRTLEIAVLDHGHERVVSPQYVIHGTDGIYEGRLRWAIHLPLLLISLPRTREPSLWSPMDSLTSFVAQLASYSSIRRLCSIA
jgi:hypothetical protein